MALIQPVALRCPGQWAKQGWWVHGVTEPVGLPEVGRQRQRLEVLGWQEVQGPLG